MTEHRDSLLLLAERGERVGAELLIERVEAALAKEPVVNQTDHIDTTARRSWPLSWVNSHKWAYAVVAFASIILAAGALWLVSQESDSEIANPPTIPAPDADTELIQSWFTSWFSGDFETASDLIGEFPRGDHPAESVHQASMEAVVTVEGCRTVDTRDRLYSCVVTYTNFLFDAVGEAPYRDEMEIRVINDHLLRPFPYVDMGQNFMIARWSRFESEHGLTDVSPCKEYASPSTCTDFMHEHLEEFRSWYSQVYPG